MAVCSEGGRGIPMGERVSTDESQMECDVRPCIALPLSLSVGEAVEEDGEEGAAATLDPMALRLRSSDWR